MTALPERTRVWQQRMMRILPPVVSLHLLLIFVQAITAGLFLSGDGPTSWHRMGAETIFMVALVQIVLAGLYWRLGGGPRSFFVISIVVIVLEVLQMGAGFNKIFWAHVPIGVGMFGGLTRQQIWVMSERRKVAAGR